MRFIQSVQARHLEVGVLLVVLNAASVAKRVVAVDQAQRIAVDERKDRDNQLMESFGAERMDLV